MITIATDNNNDIFIDSIGNIALSKEINAVANISKNRALTNLGEPEYNQLSGIPYFETIFADDPKIDLFQAAIIDSMEAQENVERVSNFEYSQDNGIFSYTLTEITSYGEIVLNG